VRQHCEEEKNASVFFDPAQCFRALRRRIFEIILSEAGESRKSSDLRDEKNDVLRKAYGFLTDASASFDT
jgi:hypothetical protein